LKKLASLAGVAGVAVAAALASPGRAADRAEALAVNPMADITDVYAWMTGTNLNLAMDVSPRDNGTNTFGPSVLYVFHLTSKGGIGINVAGGTETRVICRFASNTSVECWVVSGSTTKDYVSGNPSNTAGVTSILGKVKVFAGRRSDPAFFNQTGFNAAMTTFTGLMGTADPAGCPTLTSAQALGLRNTLATGSDDLATADVMAVVVQLDKSLVNVGGNAAVAVWGSTHVGT
jgi:hypothetical protein